MVEHLVGLQAQDNLPPYLGLAARLETFDPYAVTRGLEDRSLVRLLTMRSTVHLLVADDALTLRQFTRPIHEQERRVSQNITAALHLDVDDFVVALRGRARRRAAARQAARRGADRDVPRRPATRARVPGPRRRSPGPAAAARVLEAARRRRLRLRRQLGRPPARGAGPGGGRAALPRGVRSGLRRRRHRLVRRPRHARRHRRHGRPGPAHVCGRQEARRPADRRDRPRGHARTRAAARGVRQRLALPRRPRPGHRPGQAQELDGRERRAVRDGVRGRLARGAVAGRGRQAGRRRPVPHR